MCDINVMCGPIIVFADHHGHETHSSKLIFFEHKPSAHNCSWQWEDSSGRDRELKEWERGQKVTHYSTASAMMKEMKDICGYRRELDGQTRGANEEEKPLLHATVQMRKAKSK